VGGGADHDLLVEWHQILNAAAAARDDQQIGPRHGTIGRQGIETANGGGDLARRVIALHQDRPDQHPARETVGDPVQDVADDGSGRRGHNSDHRGKDREFALAAGLEQAFGGELPAPLLDHLQERTDAGKLDPLDHQLVFRALGIGGETAGDDHLHPVLRRHPEPHRGRAPADRLDTGRLVLQHHVEMAGGRALEAGNLAPHANLTECILDRPLERSRQIADAERRRIVAGGDVR
jgi:hypothetical protein